MDRVVLACVPAEMPASHALEQIRPGTRALVVLAPDEPLLVTAGDILATLNNVVDRGGDPDKVPVGAVIPRHEPVRAAPPRERPRFEGSLGYMTDAERTHFDALFRLDAQHFPVDRRYVVQHAEPGMAVVVTASEDYTRDLGSSTSICTCAGNPVHRYEKRQLKVPGQCNKPHAAPVTCQ